MRIELMELSPLNALTFGAFTFPKYQPALASPSDRVVRIGMAAEDEPAGLGLAVSPQGAARAEVLSIFVREDLRRRGLGTDLLARVEEELRRKGSAEAELSYMDTLAGAPALTGVLRKRNWETPYPRQMIMYSPVAPAYEFLTTRSIVLNPEFSIGLWRDVSDEEMAALRKSDEAQPWIPPNLRPWVRDDEWDRATSVALRRSGEVVGWLLGHRFDDCLRYSTGWVKKEYQPTMVYWEMMREMMRLQLEEGIPRMRAGFSLSTETEMAAFVRRRFRKQPVTFAYSYGSHKRLIPPA